MDDISDLGKTESVCVACTEVFEGIGFMTEAGLVCSLPCKQEIDDVFDPFRAATYDDFEAPMPNQEEVEEMSIYPSDHL